MKTKGSIPVYVSAGASLIVALTGFIFVNTTSSISTDLKETQNTVSDNTAQIAALKANNENVEKWLTRVEGKLDVVIKEK